MCVLDRHGNVLELYTDTRPQADVAAAAVFVVGEGGVPFIQLDAGDDLSCKIILGRQSVLSAWDGLEAL